MSEDGLEWVGFSFDDLQEELEASDAKSRRDAKVAMRAGAKEIMKASQQMCPVDKHDLENAHHIRDIRLSEANITLEIEVGGMVGDREVDDYAMLMHEFLQPFGGDTDDLGREYHLGPASEAKDAGNPSNRRVGGKFLERALDELQEELVERVLNTLPADEK